MEGSQFAQSLVSLKGDHLRYVYVLLCKMNIWDFVSLKTKDFFSKEQSQHFLTLIEKEAESLASIRDEELQLDLLLHLSKTWKLESRFFDLTEEIEKQCTDIVDDTFELMSKQFKEFDSLYESLYDHNKLDAIIHWQMKQIFDYLQDKKGENEWHLWISDILDYLHFLPDYQQEQLKEAVQISTLEPKELQKVIEKQGVLLLFTAIVDRTGFAFYKHLLQSLAEKTMKMEGQSSTTMFFSWLLNPNLLLSLIFHGGTVLYRYQNLLFNKGLIPIVILQMTLPFKASEKQGIEDLTILCDQWNERFLAYKTILRTIDRNLNVQKRLKKELDSLNKELKSMQDMKKQTESFLIQVRERLVEHIRFDENRPYFGDLTVKYNRLQERLKTLEKRQSSEHERKSGVFKSVTSYIKSSLIQTEKKQAEKKLQKIYEQMTDTVLEKYIDYEPSLTGEMKQANSKLIEIREEIQAILKEIDHKQSSLQMVKQKEKEEREKKEEAEKRTYGLKQIMKQEVEREASYRQ